MREQRARQHRREATERLQHAQVPWHLTLCSHIHTLALPHQAVKGRLVGACTAQMLSAQHHETGTVGMLHMFRAAATGKGSDDTTLLVAFYFCLQQLALRGTPDENAA